MSEQQNLNNMYTTDEDDILDIIERLRDNIRNIREESNDNIDLNENISNIENNIDLHENISNIENNIDLHENISNIENNIDLNENEINNSEEEDLQNSLNNITFGRNRRISLPPINIFFSQGNLDILNEENRTVIFSRINQRIGQIISELQEDDIIEENENEIIRSIEACLQAKFIFKYSQSNNSVNCVFQSIHDEDSNVFRGYLYKSKNRMIYNWEFVKKPFILPENYSEYMVISTWAAQFEIEPVCYGVEVMYNGYRYALSAIPRFKDCEGSMLFQPKTSYGNNISGKWHVSNFPCIAFTSSMIQAYREWNNKTTAEQIPENIFNKVVDIKCLQEAICPICQEEKFDNPVYLKCGHIFCKECIEQSFKKSSLLCPVCKYNYQDIICKKTDVYKKE